ncbi:phosphotriesterase family protein [Pectinatus frisingensis]|uniref:phosphotriesterase family protein n=1 Tax=Pectinatus frisingensis TaxID=865 RepID=UPI0018C4A4CD|nr:hypothetical protein [Pectinatus frisingensis]
MTYAMTVLGEKTVETLGCIYAHEHLLVKPAGADLKYADYTLDDIEKSTHEVIDYYSAGGGTIVEMTPINYGRNVIGYKNMAKKTKVNIICTTGFHKEEFLPEWFDMKNDDEIIKIIVDEIRYGIDDTDIHPGVIKCGTSYNQITKREKRVFKIISEVHQYTGLPISTHCDKGTMGIEQTNLLLSLGISPEKILLCHIDSQENFDYAVELCQKGVNICFDHVGRNLTDSDDLRINMLTNLFRNGCGGQIMLAGDMGKKNYLSSYGGKPGLTYILKVLKPKLEKKIGIDGVRKILIENPQHFFGYIS